MYSYNRVNIIGYQTQPVSVRQTPSGTSVTDLNILVPYNFQSETGEELTGKSFHTVTVWGSMADIAGQYVRPGTQLFISGRLQTDSWDDEQSGEKRSKTKMVALDMIILDPKDGQLPAIDGAKQVTNLLNRAEIVGNITRDPEVRTTTNGKQVVSFGVATNDRWRDRQSNETKERTEFHNIVVWGDLAQELNTHAAKGSRVYVSGRVQTRSWETQSGSKRTTTEIVADECVLLGRTHPVVQESVQMDGAPVSASAPVASSGASQEEAAVSAAAKVPSVDYESEVKAEDLPF